MSFIDFEVGAAAYNEDDDFVAQISAICKTPVRWVDVAISDYVTVPAEQINCVCGEATLKEKGRHDSNGHRILTASGANPQDVHSTVQALCNYINISLAELKRVENEVDWRQVQAECEKEAENSFKTAEELFEERIEERKIRRERYFADKEKEEGGTFCISSQKRKLEKGVTVDDDGDFVVMVLDLDLDGDEKWVELAASEYTQLPVENLLWCCADLTTMKDTGRMHEEVNPIIRIQSIDRIALAETINELIDCISYRLAALREEINDADLAILRRVCDYDFKQEGCTETWEQLWERHLKEHKEFRGRFKAQREARKAKEASQQTAASGRDNNASSTT